MTLEEMQRDYRIYQGQLEQMRAELRMIRLEASIVGVMEYLRTRMAEEQKKTEGEAGNVIPLPTSQAEGSSTNETG